MYKNQRRYTRKSNSKGRKSTYSNGRRNGNSFAGKHRRIEKKLDLHLFVKKAVAEKEISHQVKAGITFSNFVIDNKLKSNISEHGYITPTQIQTETIPYILDGRDVIGIANTGTGKTAAFLIPLVHKVFIDRNQRVLIVTPTRELAMQILDELRAFIKGMGLYALLCIGGASIGRQEKNLWNNPHFVIGTPGRLRDLIERRRLHLDHFRNFVLDEVDRMVDIGFIQDIKYFVSLLPKQRQSLFFSATVSSKVNEILKNFVSNPVTVSVKRQDSSENVDQDIVRVGSGINKQDVLHDLLLQEGFEKVLVFGRTKWGIEKLTRILLERGFRAAAIHGNKTQGQRQRALEQFKRNEVRILLATDVASRGLDIENVTHVINYDAPASYEDYIHRIGRTGRAGKRGIALTFVEK
jgi:superfamily II DNA/RNA helicase